MIIDIMQWVAIAVLFYIWLADLRGYSSKQISFKKRDRDELPLHQKGGIEPKLPPDHPRPAPPPRGRN